jgi:hypothetical protein
MSIIPQNNATIQEVNSTIFHFFKEFKLGNLLRKCNASKEKGIPVMEIFRYLLSVAFSDRSMYMQFQTDDFKEAFSKNTVYRFLNNAKINWNRFIRLLSASVINQFLRKLTSDERENVFIIDDSLYSKTGYKKTELVSKVFDHVTMTYKKGFRLLSLGWSDGNSFIPVDFSLLASSKASNILGVVKNVDKRSIAGKIRKQAQEKATDVMASMLKSAQVAGHCAKYVLFDSWFSSPKCLVNVKEKCGLDSIAMIKISSKIHYEFDGKRLNIKQLYTQNKKRRGRSKYLLSIIVNVTSKDESGNIHSIPAKIVCVRNKVNRKDWLAIICTNPDLLEEEIIRIYGKRWQIEVFFKTCKSHLNLCNECHSLSYDAMTAHTAIVFARYIMLSLEQRKNSDDRTICEIFYQLVNELQDITFCESFKIIIAAMLTSIKELLQITNEQLEELTNKFMNGLPAHFQKSLQYLQFVA